jgi:hypothetical protein
MRNAFSIEVPLRQLFDAPTIAEMATFITENQGKGAPEVPRRYFSTASSNLPWERSRLPNSK